MSLMKKDVITTVSQALIAVTIVSTAIGTLVLHFTALASDLGAHQREVWTVRSDVHQLQIDVRQLQTDVGMLTEGQNEILEWIRSQQKSDDSDSEQRPDTTEDEN